MRMRLLAAVGLAALLLASPRRSRADAPSPRAEPSPAATYIAGGVRLYEALEFTAALETFKKAERLSVTPSDDVLIHTYEGMIQGSLSTSEAAISDFRVALSLNPHAELPAGTSPKLRAVWEQVRREVVARSDVPAVAPPPSASASLAPRSANPAVTVHGSAGPSMPSVTIPEIALAGSGVLLTSVGIVVGLVAHTTGRLAANDTFQDNATSDLHSADEQQAAAAVLISVGVAAIATGVVLYGISAFANPPASDATPAS